MMPAQVDPLTRLGPERIKRLTELAEKYCPVQSLIRAAVPDFVVTWERQ